jgi:hypothetical protein
MKHPKKWLDCLEEDVGFGKHILLTQGTFPALFVLHHADGRITPFSAFFRSDEQKRAALSLMTMIVTATECVAVSFTVEAWMKMGEARRGETTEQSQERILNGVRVSEAEDRKEVLMCSIVYRDDADERQCVTDVWEIERGADGKVVSFVTIDRGLAQHQGAMINVMPEDRPTPGMVQAANMFCAKHAVDLMEALHITTPTEDRPT